MRVAVLFSGGKDSVYATGWALKQGHETVLLTVRPPEYSMMFHHPNIDATKMQAEAMGPTQAFIETTEENWRAKVVEALRALKAEGIATGAVASTYQKSRIDAIATRARHPLVRPPLACRAGQDGGNAPGFRGLCNCGIRRRPRTRVFGRAARKANPGEKAPRPPLPRGRRGRNIRGERAILQEAHRHPRLEEDMGRRAGSCGNSKARTDVSYKS